MTYQPIANPLPITGNITAETTTNDVQLDAFSRMRVSQLSSLLNLTQLHDKSPLLVDEVIAGTGTSTYSTNNASTIMATAAASDYVIRQTKQRMPYAAGKSQLVLSTFSGFEIEANVTKRIGYFSSNTVAPYNSDLDGLFVESSTGGVSINVYRFGTQVEKTTQANWNIDTLDGTGPSGVTVDWSLNQILVIDFQFLGVGRVRWYLDIDGELVKFHESMHANILDTVYMKTPNQPLRWEIRQDGVGSGSMRVICSSVNSEGAIDTIGINRAVDMGIIHVNANASGTKYALIGIRLKSTHLDSQIDIIRASILSLSTDSFLWTIMLNPTVAGTFTYSGLTDGAIEYAIGATANTVTGGIEVDAGYEYQQSSAQAVLDSALRIGSKIDGTVDELVLCATPIGSNADIIASINIKERI